MAVIERVEIRMVDLMPKTKRVDAIQSFVSQETPIVRITDADGAVGVGYSYTIGTGGPAVVELHRPLAGAGADRPRGRDGREDLARPPVPDPCDFGRRHHLARARRDRHGAMGFALPKGGPAPARDGWRRARQSCSSIRPRAAGCICRPKRLSRTRFRPKRTASAARRSRSAGRLTRTSRALPAVREAVGADFEIFTDANQAFAVDEAIRRARLYETADIGWFEEPLPADDVDGHARLSRATTHSDRGRRKPL